MTKAGAGLLKDWGGGGNRKAGQIRWVMRAGKGLRPKKQGEGPKDRMEPGADQERGRWPVGGVQGQPQDHYPWESLDLAWRGQ